MTREEIISRIRELSKKLCKTPTRRDYLEDGGSQSFVRAFGSWNAALEAAGLHANMKLNLSKEDIIALFKKYCENNPVPSSKEIYDIKELPSPDLIIKLFGGYTKFLREAGYEPFLNIDSKYHDMSSGELTKALRELIDKGVVTKSTDLGRKNNLPASNFFIKRLGKTSWKEVLEAIGRSEILVHENYTKDQLVEAYRKLYEIRKEKISIPVFEKETGISHKVIDHHFGSWKNFVSIFGISYIHVKKYEFSDEELKKMYMELSEKLGKNVEGASCNDIDRCFEFSSDVYMKSFGSMHNLKTICGYKPRPKRGYDTYELKEILQKAVDEKGDFLTQKEISEDEVLPALSTFLRKFKTGSIKEMYKRAGIKKAGD